MDPKGHEAPAPETHAFAREVCNGNKDALSFCDLWYAYCHQIDDLIDCKEDGRPTMSDEAILRIFVIAAMLYNCPFYVEHRQHLFPVVIMTTNLYADSVAWERSPVNRRRAIADVLRCCGDEMFAMVAMICGGWAHVRNVSPRIRERDFQLQHDENDQPN